MLDCTPEAHEPHNQASASTNNAKAAGAVPGQVYLATVLSPTRTTRKQKVL